MANNLVGPSIGTRALMDFALPRVEAVALAAFMLWPMAASAQTQSTLLPPECKGKTGGALDQCVRELTAPSSSEFFEAYEEKADPSALLNCNLINRADQGFCIARNEIILECRKVAKHPDFDACTRELIVRPPLPRAANCPRVASGQRDLCALRNKYLSECLQNPWLYFSCLGEKLYSK